MSVKLCRRLSGLLFLIGNIILFVTNLYDTNNLQIFAALLFMSCSVALILSANNHRWLFWGAVAVSIAYILTALSNEGDGNIFSYFGIVFGVFGACLLFRGGLQRETGKQYPLYGWFDVLDKYPLAMTGFIEGCSCMLLFMGAYYNDDPRLMISCGIWIIAHSLLILSDEYFRARIKTLF